MPQQHHDVDVIVAGAGPAGASIARLLAMGGKRVVLVDPGVHATDRLEVLPPAGYEALRAVGLTEVLGDPCIARPCLGIRRRWGSRVPDRDDFLARRGGRGFTIDRAGFDQVLCRAAARAGVVFIGGRIVGVRREGGTLWAKIATASATLTAFAAVAVDATGRRSAVARRMGAHRQVHERLIAERRSVEPSLDAGERPVWLNIEGADEAWSYQMLGPRGRRETWDVYAPGARLRGPANPRVDASSVCLSHAAGHDWIAIGDAAASFDPVTSQGLVHALATSRIAAGAILSQRGLDDEACRIYSHATAETFASSERGRAAVYDVLRARALDPRVHARHHG